MADHPLAKYFPKAHPVFEACAKGDLPSVRNFLESGVKPDIKDKRLPYLPVFAIESGNWPMLKLLLDFGLSCNFELDEYERLTTRCINTEQYEMFDNLVACGADVKLLGLVNYSLLHVAAAGGHVGIIDKLISLGLDVESRTEQGETPFREAARNNQVQAMETLFKKGANIETRDNQQYTPLIGCAQSGNLEAVEWLLAHGADVQAKQENRKTGLDWARENGHIKIIELLQKR